MKKIMHMCSVTEKKKNRVSTNGVFMFFQEFEFLRILQIFELVYKLLHVSSGFSTSFCVPSTQSDVFIKFVLK